MEFKFLTIFEVSFVWLFLGPETNGLNNLAFNKTALSSPPNNVEHGNSKAIDGIIGGDDSSCFLAGGARNGWLSVDLGKKVRIQKVVVHGRVDCCGNRLNNMVIKVSLNDIFSSDKLEICNTFSNVNNGEKLNFICKNQFKEYQFASIAEHPQPHFYVCEVEIHERELKSIGCFEDFDITYSGIDSNLESCLHKCHNLKTTFAALKDGNFCVCSDRINRRKSSKSCAIQCEGSSSHFCGGSNAFTVYTVCSPGYYGEYCDKVCHCKDRTPCNRDGKCFDVCQPGWTGDKCDVMEGGLLFQSIGCFYTKTAFEFTNVEDVTQCAHFCTSHDFKYFALWKYHSSCYCLEEKEHLQSKYYCYFNMELHHVCQPGSFGDFCLDTCHCLSGGCLKDTGACQIQGCEDGWKGPSCNSRDCSVNNGGCGEHYQCQEYDDDGDQFCQDLTPFKEDLDECSLGTSKCGNNSECHNTPGSYRCKCSNGFKNSDPITCEDLDECSINNGSCDLETTSCSNTIGSFKCVRKDDDDDYILNTNFTIYKVLREVV